MRTPILIFATAPNARAINVTAPSTFAVTSTSLGSPTPQTDPAARLARELICVSAFDGALIPAMVSPTPPIRHWRTHLLSLAFYGVAGLLASASAFAADAEPDLVPLDLLSVAGDLEVTVWAQAPLLRNPTNIDIDAQGRIWVAEGVNYRGHVGRDPLGDRILVLEDTDGDGQADREWVFVQEPELVAPLGIAVIDNQIIVSNAPDLIVYTDVDRDQRFDPRIDKRDVLLTGFNGNNHDHALHAVTFGPDGLWYLNHGNAGAYFTDRSGRTFRVGSAYDPSSDFSARTWNWNPPEIAGAASDDGHVYVGGFAMRMQPDGTNVEVIGFNFRNSYEQSVTSFGDVFQNDNDDPPAARTAYLLEYGNAGFFSRDGSRYWNADRRPGQTIPMAEWRQEDPGIMPSGDVYGAGAPTGIVFYEGDALGEGWRGTLLSCEAARNTVFAYPYEAAGAGYKLERSDFLTSNQEGVLAGIDSLRGRVSEELKTFFRPSDIAVGPDGAIYVSDWFDPRVGGHQDLDEATSGAIYRIAPKGFQPTVPTFDLETTNGQIAALKSPAVNVRAVGFTRLKAAGAEAIEPVAALLNDPNPFIRGRAIWLLAQLAPAGITRVETLLQDADPNLRSTAFQALRRINHRTFEHAATLARDPSPAVRREVAVAMRDASFDDARDILLTIAKGYDGRDHTYRAAWSIGCRGKESEMAAVLSGQNAGANAAKWPVTYSDLIWELTPAANISDFSTRARAGELPTTERLKAVTALGFIPTREAVFALLDLAENGDGMVREHATWWLLNYGRSRWSGMGVEAELKSRGIYDPDNVIVAGSVVPEPPPSQMPPLEEIANLTGDASRGGPRSAICLTCHRIGDLGVDYAPSLTGWANRQTTTVAIDSIVNPSSNIAHGFDGYEITLNDETVIHGLIESRGDPLVVKSMGGIRQLIPADRVAQRQRMRRSLMLSPEQQGLSAQDVADIVAYLKTQ